MDEELEPIDVSQCQAEIKGGSFMTFGPRQSIRCKNKPTWIAVDFRDGEFYGGMALCDGCKKVCEIQVPTAKYQKLVSPTNGEGE